MNPTAALKPADRRLLKLGRIARDLIRESNRVAPTLLAPGAELNSWTPLDMALQAVANAARHEGATADDLLEGMGMAAGTIASKITGYDDNGPVPPASLVWKISQAAMRSVAMSYRAMAQARGQVGNA